MPRPVNQVIGIAAKVSRADTSTVVDYAGAVQIYDGNWRSDDNIKFVLTPATKPAADAALFAAAIGKRLELGGTFQQDDAPGTTVRASSVTNIIVG
jgi:hypothetical protein